MYDIGRYNNKKMPTLKYSLTENILSSNLGTILDEIEAVN